MGVTAELRSELRSIVCAEKKRSVQSMEATNTDSSLFGCFFWITGELATLRQMMKVPNEPGLSQNNGLENVFLSDQFTASNPREGQARCPGAKTTSHDGNVGHVISHVCHRHMCVTKARGTASVTM